MNAGTADQRRWELPARVEERNVPAMLDRAAQLYGEKPYLRFAETERTFVEMRDAAARWATALSQAGIKPGDRVATLLSNRVEQVEALFGCLWLGAIAVPLNTSVRGPQLQRMFDNSSPRLLIAEPQFSEALEVLTGLPSVEETWWVDEIPTSVPNRRVARQRLLDDLEGVQPMATRAVHPGEPAAILYTSGTTGPSKGVIWPAAVFYWWARVLSDVIAIENSDILFNCLPLFHANAIQSAVCALLTGATCVLGKRFSASRFWDDCVEAQATIAYLLGGMAKILLDRPPCPAEKQHRIRRLFAPDTPASPIQAFKERFGIDEIILGYGSTETSYCIGRAPGHDYSNPGELGRVLDNYFEARVVNELDEDQHDDTPGELILRNKYPFSFSLGYWGMPEKTAEAFRNLWFHTGDIVARRADGVWRWVDRAKDSIRRLGENVSAWEVEEALLLHPNVAEVAVFGVPSELGDEEVMAVVVFKDPNQTTIEELMKHLEGNLAKYALPRYIRVVDQMPYTETGKLAKGALRQQGVDASTWDRRRNERVTS